jgi:hypothetical protein
MPNYFPVMVHGSHARDVVSLASTVDYEKVINHFGVPVEGYWAARVDGELIGYVEEIDRDEDRIYYEYFIMKEWYERYLKETA